MNSFLNKKTIFTGIIATIFLAGNTLAQFGTILGQTLTETANQFQSYQIQAEEMLRKAHLELQGVKIVGNTERKVRVRKNHRYYQIARRKTAELFAGTDQANVIENAQYFEQVVDFAAIKTMIDQKYTDSEGNISDYGRLDPKALENETLACDPLLRDTPNPGIICEYLHLTGHYQRSIENPLVDLRNSVANGGILPGSRTEDGGVFAIETVIPRFVNTIIVLSMSGGVIALIVGGFMFVISSGEDEMKTRGKDILFWAVVGLVVSTTAFGIVKFLIGIDFTV